MVSEEGTSTTQPVPSVDVLAAQVREQLWPHVEPAEQEAPMRAARAALDALVARSTAAERDRDLAVNEIGEAETLADEWTDGAAPQGDVVAAMRFVCESWGKTSEALADARNALADATAFKDAAALHRAREVLARLDGNQP